MLDPTSGIFTHEKVYKNGYVCGDVRGKNTYGGYVKDADAYFVNVTLGIVSLQPRMPSDAEI
ncbi:MAG: hypothetical protein KGH92_08220, partial [Xanthomonadaceae bacterium]|nr:hypothetical protein [Xanthomonadaceae bacterium]